MEKQDTLPKNQRPVGNNILMPLVKARLDRKADRRPTSKTHHLRDQQGAKRHLSWPQSAHTHETTPK